MKTQITTLRSGTKHQILNPEINYSTLPAATSHNGHSGSSYEEVQAVWNRVISENPESMKVVVKGIEVKLKANWSLSRKSVTYIGCITNDVLENVFGLKATLKALPHISIQSGNIIVVSNGKNNYTNICPSLVEIL